MGTTRTSLNADAGVRFTHLIMIEGYQYALTDGDVSAAFSALGGSSTAAHSAYTKVLGGAAVRFDSQQRAHPWRGLDDDPSSLSFTVAPSRLYDGGDTGAIFDVFARDVFKRSGGNETRLATTLTPTGTFVGVRSSDAFAAGSATSAVYVGAESIVYDTNDTATDAFDDLLRAKWTPCFTSTPVNFARTHQAVALATVTGDPLGVRAHPIVSSEPRTWIGRWVEVWILADRGGTLDVVSQGHRIFAGKIRGTGQDGNGCTVIDCESALRQVYETQLMRNQFRATLQEGIALTAGMYFQARHVRVVGAVTTIGDATVMTVVASGAVAPGQIDAGTYTAVEIGEKVTAWLQAEKTAARLLFHSAYAGAIHSGVEGRICGNLSYEDPTSSADARRCVLIFPEGYLVGYFLGWTGATADRVVVEDQARTGYVNSPNVPLRLAFNSRSGINGPRAIANSSGTWITQAATDQPPDLVATGVTGFVKIGALGYAAGTLTSSTVFTFNDDVDVSTFFPAVPGTGLSTTGIAYDDDQTLEISQAVILQGTFYSLLPRILLGTGSTSYNASADTLAETLGCGIPYSILTSAFLVDLFDLAEAQRTICMVIDKPTRFIDVFNAEFIMRWCRFVWRDGRLSIRAYSTPTTGALGAVTILETDRAVNAESAQGDNQRSTCDETFEMIQNVVRFEYDRAADGTLISNRTIEDLDSIGAHGERGFKIEARNTAGLAAVGDLLGMIAAFGATMPLFSAPSHVITRSMKREHFAQLPPLTPVIVTDRGVRAPDTGLAYSTVTSSGGLEGWPGIVISNRHDYGACVTGVDGRPTYRGAKGEVEIMIWGRNEVAPYSPCAEIDETAANGGADAGTLTVLTCKAHAHSGASEATDATHFVAGDRIRLRQIDPSTAASALSWDRIVASQTGNTITITVALSAPAWNAALFYEVVSDTYSDAVTTQRADTYQADDADYLVGDARQPYALAMTGHAQASNYTLSASTDLPSRHSTLEYGDGVALDTGSDRRIARLANSLIDHKTKPQCATTAMPVWTYGGAGTYELVAVLPVFLGVGIIGPGQTILASVAPSFASTDGTTAIVRYTLSRLQPTETDRDDVTFPQPYVQTSFTKTATTFAVPAVQTLDTRHINRGVSSFGGLAWLSIEINSKVSIRGPHAHWRVGPRSAV